MSEATFIRPQKPFNYHIQLPNQIKEKSKTMTETEKEQRFEQLLTNG